MLEFLKKSALIAALLTLGACGSMTPIQEKTAAGAAAGAAAGTVGTIILGGCIPCGTVIGGAIGAGTGYAIEKINNNL